MVPRHMSPLKVNLHPLAERLPDSFGPTSWPVMSLIIKLRRSLVAATEEELVAEAGGGTHSQLNILSTCIHIVYTFSFSLY